MLLYYEKNISEGIQLLRKSRSRPRNRLLHLVFESHDGTALVPIPKRRNEAVSDIDTVVVVTCH